MANESIQAQQVLQMLKTVASSAVPVPSDGPVLFADTSASDGGTDNVTIKTPAGGSIVMQPNAGTLYLAQPYSTDARVRGAVGNTVQTTATIEALASTATITGLTSADVGKVISIAAAGDGADLITTITAVEGTTVTVADAATDGGKDAISFVGTSDVAALEAANGVAGVGGTLLVPPGTYLVDDDLELDAGTIEIMRGVSFVVLEGFTLTFTGYVDAAPNQVPVLLNADCAGALERTVPNVMSGTGSPASAVVGIVGDQYMRDDGGVDSVLYTKESGANTNTGWSAMAGA